MARGRKFSSSLEGRKEGRIVMLDFATNARFCGAELYREPTTAELLGHFGRLLNSDTVILTVAKRYSKIEQLQTDRETNPPTFQPGTSPRVNLQQARVNMDWARVNLQSGPFWGRNQSFGADLGRSLVLWSDLGSFGGNCD